MTPTPERASFKSLISCTKSNTLSAHKDSPVSETVLFSFLRDQLVFVSQMKTEKEIVWVTIPHNGSAFSLLSLVLRQQVFFSLFLRRTKYWSTVLIFFTWTKRYLYFILYSWSILISWNQLHYQKPQENIFLPWKGNKEITNESF